MNVASRRAMSVGRDMLNSDETRAEMFATLEHDAAKGNVFVAAAITEGGAVAGDGVRRLYAMFR